MVTKRYMVNKSNDRNNLNTFGTSDKICQQY